MFETDLRVGELAQDFILPHLLTCVPGSEAWQNRLSPYITDIWWRWSGGLFKVEVKYDRRHPYTGNVAIENKAILKSSSHFVVYLVYPNVCLFSMPSIRRLIGQYPEKQGGDFRETLTLVPVQEFINKSTLI